MAHICEYCNKSYKTKAWLDNHINKNLCKSKPQPIQETQAQPIQVQEARNIIMDVILGNPAPTQENIQEAQAQPVQVKQTYKKVKDMQTQQERDQYKTKNISKGVINCTNGIYNSVLFIETYKERPFYFTKISGDDCKRLNVTYNSPQTKALTEKGTNIALAREKMIFTGATIKNYGSLSYETLASAWKEDQHLYEILGEERKPYFDIEFRYIDDNHTSIQLEKINQVLKKAFETVNVIINPVEHYAVCYNLGMCKSGSFAGLKKVSYHIIINNGYKFKSVEDANKFCAKYIPQVINESPEFKLLFTQEGLSIDIGVYTKNRLFKLPYQSKANDKRPQIPDTRFNKQEFKDFLISYDIGTYTPIIMDNVELKYEERVRQIRERVANLGFRGNNWNFDAIGEFMNNVEGIEYKTNIPGDVSVSISYLVNSIYNGPEISYKTWLFVGSAIKRCEPDYNKALELFTAWTRKYNTAETSNSISTSFDSFSKDTCGFKTLLSLARICNDKLDEYVSKPWLTLFKTDALPANTHKIVVNKRFIDYNDFLSLDSQRNTLLNPSTYFIKSPMGTGKTYNFTRYFNEIITLYRETGEIEDLRVIYLSSRRAFAESVEQEFQSMGFKNYMKHNFITWETRIICSVESLRRLSESQINNNTILIIDESESIFNIVSSETLAKNDLIANLNALCNLIKLSCKVFVMDAFLSNRSIEAVTTIRDMTTTPFYYENTYKYDERTYYNVDKFTMQKDLITSITENKRCVAVVGSRKYGKELLANLANHRQNVNYKYYNCENPLSLTSIVNQEWSALDLLMYSPTITCGISYDNPTSKYDKLYIYAVNKGSCHFRDVIQAHKRVRNFNDNEIAVCLNTEYNAFKMDTQPIYKDEIIALNTDIRAQLFFNETTPQSVKAQTNLDWVLNIHAHNILEQNIHQIYMEDVAKCFFDMENIKLVQKETSYTLQISYDKFTEDWKASTIPDIDYNEYIRIYNMLNNKSAGAIRPTYEEYKKYAMYIFKQRTSNYTDDLFDAWHTETQRTYFDNIKAFKEMLFKGFEAWRDANDQNKLIEFTDMRVRAFKLIYDILIDLRMLTNADNTYYKLDLSRELKVEDFELTAEKLKQIDTRAINQLFKNYYFDSRNNKDKVVMEINSKSASTIFSKLIEDYFGYNLKKTKTFRGKIAGVRQPQVSIYNILPKDTNKCIFGSLKHEWARIMRDTVLNFD